MSTVRDVVIVGGGPAGYTAALYAAQAGWSTLLLERLAPGGQMADAGRIPNYPGLPGIDGATLAERMRLQAEAAGAQTLYEEVTSLTLNTMPKTVHTHAADHMARAVILAMGAAPRTLGLPGEAALRGRGVSYCAVCDGSFYRGQAVAVAGGGNTAAEQALYLAGLCREVTLIHRRECLRADAHYLKALTAAPNVRFLWNHRVTALLYKERLAGLKLQNVKTGAYGTLAVAALFVAVGRAPQLDLVRSWLPPDESGCLPAGEDGRTALPGVFAAGDIRRKPLRQIVTAAADGAAAAHAAGEYLAALAP